MSRNLNHERKNTNTYICRSLLGLSNYFIWKWKQLIVKELGQEVFLQTSSVFKLSKVTASSEAPQCAENRCQSDPFRSWHVCFFLKEVEFMKVTVWNVLFLLEPCLLVQFSCGLIFSKNGRVLCLRLTVLLSNTRADVTDGGVLLQNYRIMNLDYKQVLLDFFAGRAGWPKTIQWK